MYIVEQFISLGYHQASVFRPVGGAPKLKLAKKLAERRAGHGLRWQALETGYWEDLTGEFVIRNTLEVDKYVLYENWRKGLNE